MDVTKEQEEAITREIDAHSEAVKKIPLTKGKVAMVDEENFGALIVHKWHAKTNGSQWYAVRRAGKRDVGMHHEVMGMKNDKSTLVDHVDGNGLNNVRSNLRFASYAQNAHNRRRARNNKSGFIGVHQDGDRWFVQIRHNKGRIFVGRFSDRIAAAQAYDQKAMELRGEFARLNFPPKNAELKEEQ